MYIPEHFRVRDHADAVAFMRANPFAILVSTTDDGPFATHVPVAIEQSERGIVIRGHVAKANPHWRYLEQHPLCLTIFHGAHAFVSPSLYDTRETVPTWNYAAVHVYGNARILTAPEDLLPVLHQLVGTFDPPYAGQWAELSQSYRDRMLSHIVGFEIVVNQVEAKFKLSQNRTREEQQTIINSLGESGDSTVSAVADLMREQGLGTSPKQGERPDAMDSAEPSRKQNE